MNTYEISLNIGHIEAQADSFSSNATGALCLHQKTGKLVQDPTTKELVEEFKIMRMFAPGTWVSVREQ